LTFGLRDAEALEGFAEVEGVSSQFKRADAGWDGTDAMAMQAFAWPGRSQPLFAFGDEGFGLCEAFRSRFGKEFFASAISSGAASADRSRRVCAMLMRASSLGSSA
jgi:hypothetical protein